MTAAGCRRLTVYTVLVGAKEPLNDPLAGLPEGMTSDLELDFVCLTDDPQLASPTWRFVLLAERHLPPEKLSRRPKALPHEYFPAADHSLYIDNTLTLRRLPQSADLATAAPYLLRACIHPERQTLQQEADAVALLGYDDAATVCNQLDFYAARTTLEALPPLAAGGVLLRSHHDAVVRRFGVLWWEGILAFSKRDQLAMGYALRQSGAAIDPLPGTLAANDLVRWNDGAAAPRVRASFDAARWAWMHRDDPAAQRDPKAHFLAAGAPAAAAPQRPVALLDYVCARHRSSLGSRVVPRRSMAAGLEPLLQPFRRGACRYLLVQVRDGASPLAFDDAEFAAARAALAGYLGRDAHGTLLELTAETIGSTVYQTPAQPFDLLLLLGAPGDRYAAAVQMLARLLAPSRGALVAALTSPVALADALRGEAILAAHTGGGVRSALQASRHDGCDTVLDNSVVGMRWMSHV